MKIVNGSPALANQGELEVTATDIRIGSSSAVAVATLVMGLGFIGGFFLPGAFYWWWIAGFVGGFAVMPLITDNRVRYTSEQIDKMSVLGIDKVGTKNAGGSLGGAAVGGVLFGGVGAIVGSNAGGNEIKEFTNLVIKFTDGEWVQLNSEKGFANNIQYQLLLKLAGSKNTCPI